jgi:hypothetical protein
MRAPRVDRIAEAAEGARWRRATAPHGSASVRALSCRRSQTTGSMSDTRTKLAPYLGGTLWRLRAENGTFILFNSLPIAKREPDEKAWTVIAPNWKVANTVL